MRNLKELIGQRLRDARKAAGFKNQADFAAKIGVDQSRVSRWESGENTPDPEFREAIHEVLGTKDEDLFSVPESLGTSKQEILGALSLILPTLNESQLRDLLALAKGELTQEPLVEPVVNNDNIKKRL